MDYDAIIIGSGPAGCAAAISCRRAGLNTLIVTNKNAEHRGIPDVSPSESIHAGVESLLLQLNAPDSINAASKFSYSGILTNKNFTTVVNDDIPDINSGYHIDRNIFDAALLKSAQDQGVEILADETANEVITGAGRINGITTNSGRSIYSKHIVDASGHKRIAGKRLKLSEIYFSLPLVVWTGISEKKNDSNLFLDDMNPRFIAYPSGWTWLAPESPSRYTWTRLALKQKKPFLPPKELDEFVLLGKIKVANRRWRVFRPLCKEGLILCGDAAGIMDPAAGQGILNALMSGMMAASTLISIEANPGLEAFYLAAYDDWFMEFYTAKTNQLQEYYMLNHINIFSR